MAGTSGNRSGYKIFSFNTTIRNPIRFYDFLKTLKPYIGKELNKEELYYETIKNQLVSFTNVDDNIRDKINNEIELTKEEISILIQNNPQATKSNGRMMTYLRALKDCGFLKFEQPARNKLIIHYTKLGEELLNNPSNDENIWIKAMIGAYGKSPIRTTIFNETRPFLNTLFVINELNKRWESLGNEPKGILKYEFAVFVLGMKDCNWQLAVKNILTYREKFGLKKNEKYLKSFLKENNIMQIADNSLFSDYPDEVFRKFEQTGLIIRHGCYGYVYYNINNYNINKINSILNEYKDYCFINYNTQDEYYDYLENISLPWEQDEKLRNLIIETKFKYLGITCDNKKSLEEKENYADRLYATNHFEKGLDNWTEDDAYNVLEDLSSSKKHSNKIKIAGLPSYLQLEYMISVLLGKKFGVKGLCPQARFDEEGLPINCAGGNKADIEFHTNNYSYIFEATMLTSKNSIMNNETSNIARHARNIEKAYNTKCGTILICPKVHEDIVDYFQYKASKGNLMVPISIKYFITLMKNSNTIEEFNDNIEKVLTELLKADENNNFINYLKLVNNY